MRRAPGGAVPTYSLQALVSETAPGQATKIRAQINLGVAGRVNDRD